MTDRIEREIQVDAPIERVFELVSDPGWWIEDGPERTVTRTGDVTVVELPQHGAFPVLPVSSDAPHHVAFRGGAPGQDPADGTLVEFFLSRSAGGTLLRVVESELYRMAPPWNVADNVAGWVTVLDLARERAERVRT
jgi:uncharacterized protein YndB with AHSA1/START domain